MNFPGLSGHLREIRDQIRLHQARAGWSHEVRIVAVTKSHGPEAVRAAALPRLELCGLMTLAPLTTDEGVQRKVFGSLRALRDKMQGEGFSLPELSMGMSGDFPAAVAEGATLVRLGTVLFGGRT